MGPARLIQWSIDNRLLVLLAALLLAVWGWQGLTHTPVDAIPDLSDVQVIVRTSYPGQAPQVVEDQLTYPLTTTLMAVPGAHTVRGYSFFGDSFVHVIFAEGTDLYWARSRVLEYLSAAAAQLPAGVRPQLGPDATGVGWIYSYVLVDRRGGHDLAELRSLQDWFLKFELQALPGVAEVATVGGMVRQYQIVVEPARLRALDIPLARVSEAIQAANREVGGSVLELGEAEYMVRSRGYLRSLADIEAIPVKVSADHVVVTVGDIARVQVGPEMRRGVADLDGEGEVTGGIVVMRHGENALDTIEAVKARLQELQHGLPAGVEIVETYDRAPLIRGAVDHLRLRLLEEFLVVALVCLLFLGHLPSALVAVVSLPLGVLAAFGVMRWQGIDANIMSLGGIAIAVGAMVDAALVMIENAHKHLERAGEKLSPGERWAVIGQAATEVGPALFYSLLIITLGFLPVFALEAEAGRLFSPLAYTKTYAMAAAAGLSVTLVPVLMGWLMPARAPRETANPLNRWLIGLYRPVLNAVLERPWLTLGLAGLLLASALLPLSQLEREFMPELFEGDIMYMPTTLPGLSVGKARELLQRTDRLIRQVPEVAQVFGKVGRAETATDPAPLTMIETLIRLKPRAEWRPGLRVDDLIAELDRNVQLPGISNAWVMPIRTRIDMLATGIKTPVGVKIAGPDLSVIQALGEELEGLLRGLPGTASVVSERVMGGRYIEIEPKRQAAARLGVSMADINRLVALAIGGATLTEMVEGLARYPVNLRFPRHLRDDPARLGALPIITASGAQVPLSQVATVRVVDGPPLVKSENGRPSGWTYVTLNTGDLAGFVDTARAAVARRLRLPPGYSLSWSGQYQQLLRVEARLVRLIPLTLGLILALLILLFRHPGKALLVLLSVPLALVGGLWLVWLLDYRWSVAVLVGFIALAGVATEFGVVMLWYMERAVASVRQGSQGLERHALRQAIMAGAVARVRPKAMTVATLLAALLPIMLGEGPGGEVMRRIAAPMLGGMLTAPLLSMVVMPALYWVWQRNPRPATVSAHAAADPGWSRVP